MDHGTELRNPQLPPSDPKQSVYVMLSRADRVYLVHGRGSVRECWADIVDNAPVFETAVALSRTVGTIPGRSDIVWVAVDGTAGSAIAILLREHAESTDLAQADFVRGEIAERLEHLPTPWSFGLMTPPDREALTSGPTVPVEFADIFDAAEVVDTGALLARTAGAPKVPFEQPPRKASTRNAAGLAAVGAAAAMAVIVAVALANTRSETPDSDYTSSADVTYEEETTTTTTTETQTFELPVGAKVCTVFPGEMYPNVAVNEVTTCPYAENARREAIGAHTLPSEINPFSPQLREHVPLHCDGEIGLTVICTGGVNAWVALY
ncbi:hypothetical protein ACSVDM_00945 [Nocardia sp. JW2]|uniref:hypothetical protein n=1 Tax=Nocardia sp. JW2 TaxID=3450738 RepID=UPI003F42999B